MSRTRTPHAVQSRVHSQPLADRFVAALSLFSLLGLSVTLLLFSVTHAWAETKLEPATELTMLPMVMPQAPVTIAAGCDAGVVVFTVQNNTSRWASRGHIRVADAQTGNVLRERQLVLGERQKASFRVVSADLQGDHYRVLVRLPEGEMTYVKSFSGRCS